MIISKTSMPTVALCCIVKNEAHNLRRFFDSVVNLVDQLVVVDTGSEDDTLEIAQSYGALVSSFEWCDDFAAARNFSLSLVNCDWILILDADEELVVEDFNWRNQLNTDEAAFAIKRHDLHEVGEIVGGFHLRLLKNIQGLHYEGRYHEQIQFPSEVEVRQNLLKGLYINHYGNSDNNIQLKNRERDIPILEKMREEQSIDLWRLDCLARKYIKIGEKEKADNCYLEAMERLTPYLLEGPPPDSLFWIPTILDMLGSQAIENEDFETARIICKRALEWFPLFPPINYLAGELMMALGFPLAAKGYFELCLSLGKTELYYQGDPFPMDFLGLFPSCGLGWVYYQTARYDDAKYYLNQALEFNPDYLPALELQDILEKVSLTF